MTKLHVRQTAQSLFIACFSQHMTSQISLNVFSNMVHCPCLGVVSTCHMLNLRSDVDDINGSESIFFKLNSNSHQVEGEGVGFGPNVINNTHPLISFFSQVTRSQKPQNDLYPNTGESE